MSRNILQGLIGAWCPSLGPSGYTLLDRSGRGNHGTLTNMDAGTDWVGSPGGWALDFDGSNDRVTTLLSEPFNFTTATSKFTVAQWVYRRTNATPASRVAIAKGTGGSAAGGYLVDLGSDSNGTDATKGYAIVYYGSSRWTGRNFSITDNKWFHLAVVVDMSLSGSGRVATYIDGVSTGTGFEQNPLTSILTNSNAITIGNATTNNLPFNGLLDDVAIWNRALTAPEVWQLYQAGRGGLGRLLTPQRRSYAFKVPAAAVKSYLFVNRGQVIGGGTL